VAFIDYLSLGLRTKSSDETIVVPGLSYRMDILLKDIQKQRPQVKNYMIWEGGSTIKQELYKSYLTLTNIWKKIKKENILEMIIHIDLIKWLFRRNTSEQQKIVNVFSKVDQWLSGSFKKELTYDGVGVESYIKEKIGRGLKYEMLNLQFSTEILARIFQQIKPKVLISMYSGGIYYMMGELANYFKFAALNISHGTHVPPNNEYEKIENYRLSSTVITNSYPNVAVQTPWTKKFLDFYKDQRNRIVTGPLLFSVVSKNHRDTLRQEVLGDRQDCKIIIHAATQKGRHGFRFHITESLDEYISTLNDIVTAVNQLDNVFLIIRPHPVCDLTEEEFRSLLPVCSRMKVITKGSFSKILSAADLLISYSSTCIEEAIQNQIPVILLDKWKRYNHFNTKETFDPKTIIKEPAFYITNPVILKETIKKVLDIFKDNPIDLKDLSEYNYPSDYKLNFFQFIHQVLESREPK
jgi:hypothetical protein